MHSKTIVEFSDASVSAKKNKKYIYTVYIINDLEKLVWMESVLKWKHCLKKLNIMNMFQTVCLRLWITGNNVVNYSMLVFAQTDRFAS